MNKVIRKIFAAVLLLSSFSAAAQEATDTIYNPNILFNGVPHKYEIAGIKVTGVD